ncbi:glycosyltransferase family 4 protein [Nocardioides sp. TRM66260-LWL]|uniref:glycosyltransferase n=1 Tax=Nocardioides sp. TRM66260-LWL TaxID=2874478 RepID=UPI001CC5D3FF|nr:glycosyltransferase [Nocardioides sp. TRM66260-LWL]MBZ5734903.1 glycosyltransferase family 4 protein [Nocardioides sp. TRM66260-LWL]
MTGSSPRPRAVLVTPVVPGAHGGPGLRAADWLRDLGRSHDVDVVVPVDEPLVPDAEGGAPGERLPDGTRVHRVPSVGATRRDRLLAKAWPPLVRRRPAAVTGWRVPAADLPPAVRTALAEADLVVLFRLRSTVLVEGASRPSRVILDLDDAESATVRSVAWSCLRQRRWGAALSATSTAVQYRVLERTVVRGFDEVCVAADRDVRGVRRVAPGATVHVRPNRLVGPLAGRPGTAAERTGVADGPAELLFVGSFDYPPNVEAAELLVGPVARRLDRLLPPESWRLVLAGRGAPDALAARLSRRPEVDFLGAVPDTAPLHARAACAVVPLRAGGGTKLKTIEAVLHGVPVVGLPEAFRGLPLRDGEHVRIARSARGLAEAVQEVLEQPRAARARAEAARRVLHEALALDGPLPPMASAGGGSR